MSDQTLDIQSDAQGFVVGTRRLAEIAKGIDHLDDNTNEILELLKSTIESFGNKQVDTLQRILNQSRLGNKQQTKIVEAIQAANSNSSNPRRTRQPTIDVDVRRERRETQGSRSNTNAAGSNPSPRQRQRQRPTVDVEARPQNNNSPQERQRDSRGRFTGGGGSSSRTVEAANTTNMLKTAFKKAIDVVAIPKDTTGYDPTVDAINEVSTLLAPAARGFRMMGRGAAWLYKRKTKRDEILPEAQSRHNDQVDRHNREERKLLKKIADLLGRGASNLLSGSFDLSLGGGEGGEGGGAADNNQRNNRRNRRRRRRGGGRGGRFAGIAGGVGKVLGKGLPVLGAAISALSLLDWKDKTTEEKGESVGSVAGGAIGGAIGTFLGPVGTVVGGAVGAWAGEKLGGVVAPYVKDWTDSLKRADIPGRITSSWNTFIDGMNSYVSEQLSNAAENTKEATSIFQDKINSFGDFGASVIDRTLAAAGNKAAQERLRMRDQGLIGYQSNVYQARTTNNAPSPLQTFRNTGAALSIQPATGKYAPLLDEIARGESSSGAFGTSGYDAVYSGAKVKPSKPISEMTVGEVKAYQQQLIKAGSKSTAVGKYQFIHNKGAFGRMAAEAGLKDTDKFDSKAQDRLAIHYAGGEKQLDKWIKSGNYTALSNKVAQQWSSQKNAMGYGNYDGDGLNYASHGGIAVMREIGQRIQQNEADNAKAIQPANNKLIQNTKDTAVQSLATPSTLANQARSIVAASNNSLNKIIATNQPIQNVGTPIPKNLKLPQPKQPKVETIKQPVSSQQGQAKQQVDAVIPQNISDRGLAHTATGGLGFFGIFG